MDTQFFINEAVGALPEPYKSSFETRTCLAVQGVMVAANPNFPPLIYKDDEKVWREISFEERRDPWIGPRL